MKQYIDKAAIVAEIKKRIAEGEMVAKDIPSSAIMGLIQAYKNTLSFLDTLEVKEVDLDKEVRSSADQYDINNSGHIYWEDIVGFAKHFYELGLKAQKGE